MLNRWLNAKRPYMLLYFGINLITSFMVLLNLYINFFRVILDKNVCYAIKKRYFVFDFINLLWGYNLYALRH